MNLRIYRKNNIKLSNCYKERINSYYIKYSHKAYYDGHISVERLAEMLLTDIYDLPNLLDQFKLKL